MHDAAFHARLDAIAPAAVLAGTDGIDLGALERHASAGCSPCARALVNAREHAVLLAAASPKAPRPSLRARVLSAARRPAPASSTARAAAPVRDPSATVAHLHLAGPDEEARTREVDALDALRERPGDGMAALLAEIAGRIAFPLLFVSILRGDRVGYRAQHGFPGADQARHIRREMTFCTHCVSGGAPLVVEDAGAEPFFRGSKMVQRFGIRAYVGVPLRTSTGVVIGTLCALDVVPRRRDAEVVRALERSAAAVVAEIEIGRGPERGA